MASIDENDQDKLIELFSCKLNSLDPHIYKIEILENKKELPKFLPCGNTVCDTCIKDFIKRNENKFAVNKNEEEQIDILINCPLCMNHHSLASIKASSVIPNKTLENAMELYKQQIAISLLKRLKCQADLLNNIRIKLENDFNHFTKLDAHFNMLSRDLKSSQIKVFEEALKNIRKSKENNFTVNRSLPAKENIVRISFLKSTNLLENLGSLNKLKNYVFRASEKTTIEDFVMINALKYTVITEKGNRIVTTLNDKFQVIEKYENKIDSILFENSEVKLASDLSDNVFISIKDLNEVFICDVNNYNRIKFRIGPGCSTEIVDLIDIFIYEKLVYILDSTKGLKVYSIEGVYIKSISLYVPNLKSEFYDIIEIKNPQELYILNNLIVVVSNNDKIYLFNLNDGEYIQSVDSKDCFISVLDNRYLAVLDTIKSKLLFYEKGDDNLLIEYVSININLHSIQNIIRIKCFNNRLFIITQGEIIAF